nr:receptor-like protein 12 [Ipomoea batatas]
MDHSWKLDELIIGWQPIKKLSWDEGSDCCKWEGITCDASTGHIIALDLSCSGLEGSINTNSTLFQLHHLQSLNLAFNDFSSGSLPHAIGSLTSLTHLNLSASSLSGAIPSKILQLSKLVSLDLSFNFEGNSWDLLFHHNLTKLEVFSMAGTGLSCTIPRNISAPLRYVDLSFNYIFGSIPESIFQLPKLESLILYHNSELVGSLPKLGWNCNQTLQVLVLSFTNISGELPNSISNLRYAKLSQGEEGMLEYANVKKDEIVAFYKSVTNNVSFLLFSFSMSSFSINTLNLKIPISLLNLGFDFSLYNDIFCECFPFKAMQSPSYRQYEFISSIVSGEFEVLYQSFRDYIVAAAIVNNDCILCQTSEPNGPEGEA